MLAVATKNFSLIVLFFFGNGNCGRSGLKCTLSRVYSFTDLISATILLGQRANRCRPVMLVTRDKATYAIPEPNVDSPISMIAQLMLRPWHLWIVMAYESDIGNCCRYTYIPFMSSKGILKRCNDNSLPLLNMTTICHTTPEGV